MTISVEIIDRLYDYTDEEKAAEIVALFQASNCLTDEEIITIWATESDVRRIELERLIFQAIDLNGSVKRAQESIPGGMLLFVNADG